MPTELVLRNVNAAREDAVKELSNSRFMVDYARGAASEYATALREVEERHRKALSAENAVKLERDSLEAHLTGSADQPAALRRRIEQLSLRIKELHTETKKMERAVADTRHRFEDFDTQRMVAEQEVQRIEAELKELDDHIRRLN